MLGSTLIEVLRGSFIERKGKANSMLSARNPRFAPERLAKLGGFAIAAILSIRTADWVPAVGAAVLIAIWEYLPNDDGVPVLPIAFSFQWLQVYVGVFYGAITGRPLTAHGNGLDYHLFEAFGTAWLIALLLGVCVGAGRARNRERPSLLMPALDERYLWPVYVALAASQPYIANHAWDYPRLTQLLIYGMLVRYAFIFILFRRLIARNAWHLFVLLLGLEAIIGTLGGFAGYRDAFCMAALALLERFRFTRIRHYAITGMLALLLVSLSVIWTGIKSEYRSSVNSGAVDDSASSRAGALRNLTSNWFTRDRQLVMRDADRGFDRLWQAYYSSFVFYRVPIIVPHSGGAIMNKAIAHVLMPRLFNPDKPELESDSLKVREYSGLAVAGTEAGTSIAFPAMTESFVDYGAPLMFLPAFAYAAMVGALYRFLRRRIVHPDVAIPVLTIFCWFTCYLFERSWAKLLGITATIFVTICVTALIFDRVRTIRYLRTLAAPARRVAAMRQDLPEQA